MNQTCPHPDCSAAYDLTGQKLGAKFACKMCHHELVIKRDGLHIAESTEPTEPAKRSPPMVSLADLQLPANGAELVSRMRAITDLSSWAFGGGVMLCLCALFFPIIDQAKVSSLEAKIVAGDLRLERTVARLNAPDSGTKDAATAIDEHKKYWAAQKDELEEDAESSELTRRTRTYWYREGTLIGFVLLVIGSFGYLNMNQPAIRRILGCVVLAATVLVVLNSLARFSFRFEVGPTGGF